MSPAHAGMADPRAYVRLAASGIAGEPDAVSARNVTVPRGQGELQHDFIVRVLGAVADVLWMCDYFTGQKWAFQNLSEQMRNALPIPAAADGTPSA